MDIVTTLFSFILSIGGFAVLVSVALQLSGDHRPKPSKAR
jgi:hypothetical protein